MTLQQYIEWLETNLKTFRNQLEVWDNYEGGVYTEQAVLTNQLVLRERVAVLEEVLDQAKNVTL